MSNCYFVQLFLLTIPVYFAFDRFVEQLLIPFTLIESSTRNQHFFSVQIKLGSNNQIFKGNLAWDTGVFLDRVLIY